MCYDSKAIMNYAISESDHKHQCKYTVLSVLYSHFTLADVCQRTFAKHPKKAIIYFAICLASKLPGCIVSVALLWQFTGYFWIFWCVYVYLIVDSFLALFNFRSFNFIQSLKFQFNTFVLFTFPFFASSKEAKHKRIDRKDVKNVEYFDFESIAIYSIW